MSSFRIMDTKFRILKGGKIGLAMSIAMIGGMLSLGSTSAAADSYFTSNQATFTNHNVDATGYGTIDNWLYWNSVSNSNVSSLETRVSTTFNDVWFDPTSMAYSTLSNAWYVGGGDSTVYGLTANTLNTLNSLTLTFSTGSNSNDIRKDAAVTYSAMNNYTSLQTDGWRNFNGFNTSGNTFTTNSENQNVVADHYEVGTSSSYQANLIFNGVNTVTGYTDIDQGTITIAGSNVNFAGTVEAGNISIGGSGIYFNSTVYLYNALTFAGGYDITLHNGLYGNINFQGNNGKVTLDNGNIEGNIDTTGAKSGTLAFGTSGTSTVSGSIGSTAALKEIELNGRGTVQVHDTNVAITNFNNSGTLDILSGIFNTTSSSSGRIDFNNYAGTINVYDGVTINSTILSTDGTNGELYNSDSVINVVNFRNNATMNGDIGSSASRIAHVNIGLASDGITDTVEMNGNIYTTSIEFYDNDELLMRDNKNITGKVLTQVDKEGILTLAGGIQNVTGSIGTDIKWLSEVNSGATSANSTFQSDVYAETLNNTGTGTSNFTNNVTATTINVASGISNFTNNVTATTTNIGTGTGNFNTNDEGVTVSDIAFTGTGIANLHTGLTGHINFAGNNANVNVWQNQSIVGNITTATTNNTGIVNFKGNGTLDGTVGASNMGISALNINTDNTSDTPLSAEVTVTGHVYANNINLNDGTLRVAVGKNLIDTEVARTTFITTTGAAGPEASGELFLMGGNQLIDGQVGTAAHKISGVYTNMSESGTTTFNEKVYISQLTNGGYWSDVAKTGHAIFNEMAFIDNLVAGTASGGVIDLNGINADNPNASGMIGQLLLSNTSTTVNIGDNVNLTVIDLGDENHPDGVAFTRANNATMHFVGDSTVIGQVGGGNDYDNSTFAEIYAGANGKTVTFKDDVHVLEGSLNPATFYVSGTGTVNFEGNLYGDLVYNADGVVNVSNGKSILVNTVPVAVTTIPDGTGTLNYLGSTTLDTDIGTSAAMLKSVTFNSASNNVTQNIGYDVYADTVTIGGASGTTAISLVDVTGTYDYAGATTIKEYIGGTAANITSNVTLGGNLVIANNTSAINFGTSHVTVGMNHNGTTPGAFTTSNGAMSFTVNTQDITGADEAISTSAGSGLVTTTVLNMSGNEKIHINYVGSLANNGTYTLINGTSGTSVDNTLNTASVGSYNQNENGNVSDNSFSIDTRIATNNAGDLTVYSDRTANASYTADELYVQKSETVGHFSNNAAMTLASISADGSQTGDMIEVIQKLELDSFGYGNNQENLAVQVQKLAPIVNTSFAQTSIGATKLVTDTVGSRLSDVRGLSSGEAVKDKGVWAKVTGSTASQDKVGQYDGYNLSSGGVVFGIDKELNNGTIIGLAAGYTNTKTEQDDFRDGDKSTTNSYQLAAYASKTYDKAYVDGSLSYTRHNTDGERTTAIDRVASYDVDADQLSAKINGGYNFMLENKVALTPFASLEYSTIKQNAYKETGAGAINLSVDDVTVNRGAAGLGVKISKEIKTEKNTYIPEFKLGANKYFGDDNVEVEAQFEQGNKFVTRGADMTDVMYNAGLGLKTKFTEDTSVSLSTDYERNNDGDFQGVNGQLTFRMQF